jgi:hypothetical protein
MLVPPTACKFDPAKKPTPARTMPEQLFGHGPLYQFVIKPAITRTGRNGRNGGTFPCIISVSSVAMTTNQYYQPGALQQ